MKTKDICKEHDFILSIFESWLYSSGFKYKSGFLGVEVQDNIGDVVNKFKEHQINQDNLKSDKQKAASERLRLESEQRRVEQERVRSEAEKKQAALASMLITSGFNFEGYSITKYSGYISGDDAVQADRPTRGWTGGMSNNVGEDLLKGLSLIRRNALAELKEAAYALGCNAVIGVDFDYLTLDPETVTPQGGTLYLPFLFAVTANGNAVVIEKNSRSALG